MWADAAGRSAAVYDVVVLSGVASRSDAGAVMRVTRTAGALGEMKTTLLLPAHVANSSAAAPNSGGAVGAPLQRQRQRLTRRPEYPGTLALWW